MGKEKGVENMRKRIISVVMMMVFIMSFMPMISVQAATYLWPAPGVEYISCYYGNGHDGLDIAANGDHEIVAAREGTVFEASSTGCSHINNYPNACCNWGMGNYVKIRHSDGTYATYMHMRYGSVTVSVGQYVTRGTKIGMMGSSGNSSGQHLHFQLSNADKSTINVNPSVLGYDKTNSAPAAPSGGWITADKTSIRKGETVNFNFGINNVVHSGVGIDKDGKRYYTIEATGKSSASYTFNEVGTYSIVYEGYNSAGTMGYSNWLTITVSENTYTVTYNANGGSGAPSAQTKTHNQTLTLSKTKPTRTGYTFLGWSKSSGASTASYQPGASFTDNANTTLYAIWRINTYTITYNLNGGSGDIKAQTKTHGTAVKLSDKVPTRTGYTFLGWAKSSSATGAEYSPSTMFGENANTTLFAVWKINTYKVTFDANGGKTPPEPQTKVYGTALALTKTRPVRPNYSFEGWNTKADGTGTTYAAGASYTANSAVTLYAMWDPNAVSMTLDPNGGIWNNSAEMQILWNKYNRTEELEVPKRDGFELAGFTLDSTSDAVIYPYGKPLFTDTKFENGMNGMQGYNHGVNINLEKVSASSDCPTKADYMIKITTPAGKSSPAYGGFAQIVNSKANGVFYQIIVAKIPKGYTMYDAANSIGNYQRTTWLTSNRGTGEWETYILKRHLGATGKFSTFGHIFIDKTKKGWNVDEIEVPEDNPFTWYVAYANIFDATDLTSNRTKDPNFISSYNGISVYNNFGNGDLTLSREIGSESTNKYKLTITSAGEVKPHYGGFLQKTQSQPNHVYYHFIKADIPVGYSINYAYNQCGDDAKFEWLTDQRGVGTDIMYIYKVTCGSTGHFDTFGHVFITKNENTYDTEYNKNSVWGGRCEIEKPLTWYVWYSDVVDMTPQYKYGESGKITARWLPVKCEDAKPNMKNGSTVFADTPITLSSKTDGADIYYTTDGTHPTEQDGTLYTGEPITLSAGEKTIRTIAVKDGMSTSYERSYVFNVYENQPETSTAVATTATYHNVVSEIKNPLKGKYIFALYDEHDVLLKTVVKDINEKDTLLEFKMEREENADYARVYIWNNLSNMYPFMDSELLLIQ